MLLNPVIPALTSRPHVVCRLAQAAADLTVERILEVTVDCRTCGYLTDECGLQAGRTVSGVEVGGIVAWWSPLHPLITRSLNNPPHRSSSASTARKFPLLPPRILAGPAPLEADIWAAKGTTQGKFEVRVVILHCSFTETRRFKQEAGVVVGVELLWMKVDLLGVAVVGPGAGGSTGLLVGICGRRVQGGGVTEQLEDFMRDFRKQLLQLRQRSLQKPLD